MGDVNSSLHLADIVTTSCIMIMTLVIGIIISYLSIRKKPV
ncbi:MAG: hypothetical protein ACXAD7_15015 [Candidatus Kariarchaeaceae archaeon]